MTNRLSLQTTGLVLLATLAASALVTAGCSSDTQSGGTTGTGGAGGSAPTTTSATSSDSSSGTTSTSSTSTGTGGGQAGSNIALLQSELTMLTDADQSAWLDTGEKLDPTTLFVILSSEAKLSCAAPKYDFGTVSHTVVIVGLTQAMQKVGTYDLASSDVIGYGDFWLGDGMGNGGGGKMILNKGTVEIVSLDAATITVRFAGLSGSFTLENGDHAVVRCP
jgi:hypothetical protein